MSSSRYKPIVLVVIDGWGLSSSWTGNPIAMSNPPNISSFWRIYPHKVLLAFGQEEGRNGPLANSRLAHLEISAGREVLEDSEIIDRAIADKSFYRNPVLLDCFKYAKNHNSNIHLIGLLSDTGINSQINHLLALLEMAHRQNFPRVFCDAITDGIDGKVSALKFVEQVKKKFQEIGLGQFSSVFGRNHVFTSEIDRLVDVSNLLFKGAGAKAATIEEAITQNYSSGKSDAEITPTLIKVSDAYQTIKADDVVIVFNLRAEKSRPLTYLLTNKLKRLFWSSNMPAGVFVATMVRYSRSFTNPIIFPREIVPDTLPEVLARYQKRNLRLTETLKKPHVTFYFNGGREEPLAFEERNIVKSPLDRNFDKSPELGLAELSRQAVGAILSKKYDFILVNVANADILGHTGNLAAAIRAVMAIDKHIGLIVEATFKTGGAVILTADHGNIEQMIRATSAAHTKNPVPFILIAKDKRKNLIQGALTIPYSTLSKIVTAKSSLRDIAPTILELMGLPKPQAMTGHSLLNKLE